MGRGIKHEQATIALRMRRKKNSLHVKSRDLQNETDGNSNSLRTLDVFPDVSSLFDCLKSAFPLSILISAGAIANHDLKLQ